ncbi:MAG: hypothetical protein J6A37_06010 [Oscillospiraceae bacterium]|nr:hypothetical protein [Oscillospiraceae bacterium]
MRNCRLSLRPTVLLVISTAMIDSSVTKAQAEPASDSFRKNKHTIPAIRNA